MTPAFVVEAWFVGVLIGLIGIGGIFLIPLLVATFGEPLETAIGTALVTFAATACISTAIYAAKGRIDWRVALRTSVGSVAGGVLGARLGVALPERTMALVFAAFLMFAGVAAIARTFERRSAARGRRTLGIGSALAVGAAVGIGSGLTGVGGAAILVPLLLLMGIPATVAIALSQPVTIAAAASGALGHIAFGHVDYLMAARLVVIVGTGVTAGAFIHRRFSAHALQPLIGCACVVLAVWTFVERVRAS